MSQAGILNISSSSPTIPTSFETDNGTAVPLANVLIVNALDSTENDDDGIITKGGVVGTGVSNRVDVVLTNRATGQLTTANATLTTIISLALGATPGIYVIYGDIVGFKGAAPAASGAYTFVGAAQTDGITATELGVEYHDTFETVDFNIGAVDIFVTTSGNNIIVQVQGIAATSINWNALLQYRKVN